MAEKVANESQLDHVEKRWFAVRTRSKAEKVVHKQLLAKDIEAYLPLLQLVRRYQRKVKTVQLPLIPGYIFVRIAKAQYVATVETEHVAGFVKFGNIITAVPQKELDLLRRITGFPQEVEVVSLDYVVGEEVEIATGNLAGMIGKLVEVKQKNRVLIEIRSVNLGLLLEIDTQNLLKTKYILAR
jgi:transcription antitermination factor NusG